MVDWVNGWTQFLKVVSNLNDSIKSMTCTIDHHITAKSNFNCVKHSKSNILSLFKTCFIIQNKVFEC